MRSGTSSPTTEPLPATVFVVDDEPTLRESLTEVMSSAGLPTRTYASAEEFLDDYDPLCPGCLILDVRMPGMSGLDLQHELVRRHITLPIIIMSAFGTVGETAHAFRAGAFDFLEKPVRAASLLERVRAAIVLDSSQRQARNERKNALAVLAALSPRQREVLERVVLGDSNKVIAIDLSISERTVEAHRAQVMQKTGATSAQDLVRLFMLARGETE